ncbi:MAG: hypothetical protein AAGB51_06130 [Planctomycetota bacterium]
MAEDTTSTTEPFDLRALEQALESAAAQARLRDLRNELHRDMRDLHNDIVMQVFDSATAMLDEPGCPPTRRLSALAAIVGMMTLTERDGVDPVKGADDAG